MSATGRQVQVLFSKAFSFSLTPFDVTPIGITAEIGTNRSEALAYYAI